MADRSVVVRLKANVTDFRAGMAQAGKDVSELQRNLASNDAKMAANTKAVSRGMLLIGAAGVAGAGLAVKAFMGFDKEMSNVKAVSNATAGEMDNLRAAALKAGKDTVFSASESAKAEAELARAGVSTSDILGGALTGSLNLASAGQLELADAATISAQAMNIFNLKGKDVTHIADVLAAGANKSAADVKGLGDALRQGGLVAAQTGLSLEDTVGTLSAFADSALIGSDAGTSLKTMLQRLSPTGGKAASAMEQIGLNAYDAQGNFIGLEGVAGQLQKGLGKLSEEERAHTLSVIFGSDAVRAASLLYDQGAAGIRNYTSAVNDNGAAARTAATQLDNLAGDVEQLKGSLETALIQGGSGSNGALRTATQSATKLVNTYANLPTALQGTVTAVAGIGGGVLLALGGIGTLAPKIREGRAALQGLGQAGVFADKALGRVGRAAGLAAIGFAAIEGIGTIFDGVNAKFERFVTLTEGMAGPSTAGKIKALTVEMERLRAISEKGANTDLGFTNIHWTDWTNGAAAAGDKADSLADRIADLKVQQKIEAEAAKDGTGANADLANAMSDQVSPAADEAAGAIQSYKDALDNLNGVNISAARAQLALASSYDEARKAADKSTKVSDDETSALLDLADQANQTAGAMLEQGKSEDVVSGKLRTARRHFIDTAESMGYTHDKARDLADAWLSIPTKRQTKYTTPGIDGAVSKAQALRDLLLALPSSVSIPVRVGVANKLATDGARAAGGPVRRGGMYLVGERGPELFRANMAGSITAAGPTRAILSGTSPVSATYTGGGRAAPAASGSDRFMGDLIVHTHQERVEDVLPRVLDAQMYRMGR